MASRMHVQATAAQQEAASSFQLCIASALQAGDLSSAVAAAEETVACLGNADRQTAAEALLTAQSCRAVADMEAIYQAAAPPQARLTGSHCLQSTLHDCSANHVSLSLLVSTTDWSLHRTCHVASKLL